VVHIYHLLFVDDILLFSKANPKHLRFLCALHSEAVSNLKINLSKSKLVLMSNIGLASSQGCMVSSLPMNYLNLLLGAPFKAKAIWNGVI
jgi:hypothetical protein